MRQLGYLILYKSDDHLLEGFMVDGKEDLTMLNKIIWAWENVHLRGKHKGKCIQGAREPYYQWVTKISQDIMLPFVLDPST